MVKVVAASANMIFRMYSPVVGCVAATPVSGGCFMNPAQQPSGINRQSPR
jgi:hypothetical protein